MAAIPLGIIHGSRLIFFSSKSKTCNQHSAISNQSRRHAEGIVHWNANCELGAWLWSAIG
jgi:hypothetical protein